ncbi:MAG TPA: AAA family ATPase [Oscillatoriaceae cyanobacterium M33_DOE_052]|uniref:histidine kinase n=1 Tax=Planktothricoides sp. SpSt-374 TaxID=2282167 RepID=A0A7C3ZUV9_9CYAN|nr:AAA family ATPase [Oscillatoriaceae cyanobacterium M33_DOE_052]
MIAIPGYQILSLIYESSNSAVYRGRRNQDNLPVIIKILKQEYPTEADIARYQQEYEIASSLDSECSVKAYEILPLKNTLVMVLEDFGGESLRILMDSQKFTLLGFLGLAIKIAESLGELHARNIIHKDINPSNIVYNPVTGELKIIDFSIAMVLGRTHASESGAAKLSAHLEGTFAYMSPEQTGRMNRQLDYRTDFYSLGATFYELLLGELPFTSGDAMELVHAHIAKQPVPPHERLAEIPKAMSDIVMKLMAKNPEERYQSAWGLKADLATCLEQLQGGGIISEFSLGRQDISEKFQIPQKLYGRQAEIDNLLAAFDRVKQGATEMILVAGYSGIGKSALVAAITSPIVREGGYFITGKFDQFQRSIPYSAVVSAFSELVRLLLSQSEAQLKQWREKILAALGPNGQIIIDVIPEVELIIGPQPPVPELKPAEAQNRFNFVFQNFIEVFCTPEHPLVIFLDDLQWADSGSLKLLKLMMADEQMQYLFLIGAYRDNEVSPTHPLMMTVEALRQQNAVVSQETLTPLNVAQVAELIADTLHREAESVTPLADLVVRKTEGNPFFVNQFLKTLYQENLITFAPPQTNKIGGWQWDIAQIEAVGITENVVELMIGKLKKLPEATQEVLRLGACLGSQFDLNTLCLIYEMEATTTFQGLLPAIKEGLLLPISDMSMPEEELINFPLLILSYKFLHDRVQQAAYSLIDDDHKQAVHLRIGRMLLASTPEEYRSDRVFELVDHMNVGRYLITEEAEKLELAALNLEAGKKAQDATAYVAAKTYLTAGIEGLPKNSWEHYYNLAFNLHKERAVVEYLNGNFEASLEFIHLTLERAKTIDESAEIYNLLIVQYGLRAKYDEAIRVGRTALALLGVDLPEENLQEAIGAEFAAAKEKWQDQDIAALVDAPPMTNSEKKLALKLLTNLGLSAYLTSPQLWMVIFLKGVNISLEYGSTADSCICYTNYGILLTSVLGDYQSAYQFGQLAIKLIDKWNAKDLKCRAYIGLANGVNYWFQHIKDSNTLNHDGYQAALECGDLEYAGYALHNTALNGFFEGKNLGKLIEEVPRYLQFCQKTKNQFSSEMLLGLELGISELTRVGTESATDGEPIPDKDADYQANCQANQNFYGLCVYLIRSLQIRYLCGDFAGALQRAQAAEKLLVFITGTLPVADYTFYHALTLAALYESAPPETSEEYSGLASRSDYWEQLTAYRGQLQIWANNSPANFGHKLFLVEAEMARLQGQDLQAIDLYDRAIESAVEYEFVHQEALGNELAAKFWINKGKSKIAKTYLSEAMWCYQRWGALHKVEQLQIRYPQLLAKTSSRSLAGATLNATYTSTGSASAELDLVSVMKATRVISGEIVLEKLLSKLMKILIENAGAQKGCLILSEQGQLKIAVAASADSKDGVVQPGTLVEAVADLPQTVINYVERSGKDLVLGNAAGEGRFTADPYIAARNLKSLLCTPIVNGGKLIGILYLENNLTTRTFTSDRLEVLRILSSQAAISLENAILYASLEQKVTERTRELNEKNTRLEQTLQELQRTQAQLIQTEKMSGLGQMVAGVAHEINNPVSFIYGNIAPATQYVRELLNLIDLYQEHYPKPVEEIQEMLEDMELEFMVEDLQKLLHSMHSGAERIRNIVLSLRNFSRLDEAEMKPVDLHEGIESTLMLLQPRLRAESDRAEIEVVKDYAKLPKVTCYASQINQVLMNILGNACDALETMRTGKSTSENQPAITIRTAVENKSVKIIITDNGPGMPESVCNKIFDPFFTTKPVGSGTGLGLSVAYQIVVDKHGGHLSCSSTPGSGAQFTIEIPV